MGKHASDLTLNAYHDKELTRRRKAAVANHLKRCETCAARLRELKTVDDVFGAVLRRRR